MEEDKAEADEEIVAIVCVKMEEVKFAVGNDAAEVKIIGLISMLCV